MGLLKSELEISLNMPDSKSLPGWDIYLGDDGPQALVRAQLRLELPWVLEKIRRHIGYRAHILDLDCGFGGVANELARRGHRVIGVDPNVEALSIAKMWDQTESVQYRLANRGNLPFGNQSFDVVTALDVFCQVDDCAEALHEATRVLKPGGIFLFNNFSRTWRAWLMAVKGPELFIKNVPPGYHDFKRFKKPQSFARQLRRVGLEPHEFCGMSPVFLQKSWLKLIWSGSVGQDFQFHFCRTPWWGYVGFAQKRRFH